MKRIRAVAGALVACSLLQGCVALPIPVHRPTGQVEGSRPEVSTSLPDQVIAGRTTRTDVLLLLGEPDGRGAGDRWFTYGSRIGRGGLGWLLFVGVGAGYGASADVFRLGAWESSHRAIVHFGDDGVVSSVEIVEKACNDDCLDIGGTKIKAADEVLRKKQLYEQQAIAAGSPLARYGGYLWKSGPDCSLSVYGAVLSKLDSLVIAEHGLVWKRRHTDMVRPGEQEFLSFADLADVRPVSSQGGMTWITLHKRDDSCVFVHVGPIFMTGEDMRNAREEIGRGIAAAAAPDQKVMSQTAIDRASDR